MIEALKEQPSIISSQKLNKRYDVVLTATEYQSKPKHYGRIHSELNSADNEQLTLYELLEEINKGRTWRNGIYKYPELKENEKKLVQKWQSENNATDEEIKDMINQYHKSKERTDKKHRKNILASAKLAVLDIDDLLGHENPLDIMAGTGAIAMYYTFSHNRMSSLNMAEKRYRLLFDLSEPVTSKGQLEHVQKHLINKLLEKYPYLDDQTIADKSHGVENLTQFHGTNKGYVVNEHYKTVEVAELIEEYEKELDFEKAITQLDKMTANTSKDMTSADEILEIAHFIGDLNGVINHKGWTTLSIGLWNTAQLQGIDDSVIIEALSILDGNRQNERYYSDFKKPLTDTTSRATAKTLYKIASEKGYKFKRKEQPKTKEIHELENAEKPIMIEQYIGKEHYLNLLQNENKRILLVSETGTGKTRSAIDASRELNKQNKKSFVYIALPVIALSEQAEKQYGTNTAIIGTNKVNTRIEVNKAINNDTRLLIGTYNKAQEVCNYLKGYDITIIADEAHKSVTDYSYRGKVINELFNLADDDRVRKFVGMTGTPSEIDLTKYDSIVTFKLKNVKVLADKLQFVEYYKANDYEDVTARMIEQELSQGKKILAIVDNKTRIKNIAEALRTKKIKVATISADEELQKNETYKQILDEEKFDDKTDVILSTRVLVDGINIQNTKDYVLIIAPNHSMGANFYNIDLIRQASNRFRNQYEKILVPLFVLSEINEGKEIERASDKPFNLEYRYQQLIKTANVIKAVSESEFKNNIKYFTPSIAEKLAGLFKPREAKNFNFKLAYKQKRLAEHGLKHDEQLLNELIELESKMFEIDERHIRTQAIEDKETYYSLYPYAFRKAIAESVEVLEVESIAEHHYFSQADSDLTKILEDIGIASSKSNKEKREHLREVLQEPVYAKIQQEYFMKGSINESETEWQMLKEAMNSLQYRALKNVVTFLEHEQALDELEYVTNSTQVNELKKHFEAITELTLFKGFQEGKTQVTMKVFEILNEKLNNSIFSSLEERDEYIEKLAKEFKIKRYTIAKRQKIFKQVFKKFFVTGASKQKKVDGKNRRLTQYEAISFKHMADKREKSEKEIIKLYQSYRYSEKRM